MKKYKAKAAIGMLVALLMVMGTVAVMPTGTYNTPHSSPNEKNTIDLTPEDGSDDNTPYLLDQSIREDPVDDPATANLQEDQGDVNYNTDTGNSILKSLPIYPGEIHDEAPGRGTQGYLDPSSDADDWYYFAALEGQTINIQVTPESNFDIELADATATTIASSANTGTTAESIQYAVPSTGRYFLHIYTADDAAAGHYTLDVTLQGQNDAGSGNDAGNTMESAMSISPGAYEGYLDANDWEDWYTFSVSSGQGIKIALTVIGEKSDFDIYLYNPSGEMVMESTWYAQNPNNPDGDDVIEYPADASGTWYLKIDIFPGWDESKWPDNYYLYGSGPYSFELQVGVSVQEPPGPIPQPDVTPIAQTFIVNNDDATNNDEYGYLAAIPAANYMEDGQRYVSPIVYQGDNSKTWWFGTTDDTTQYLLDDWHTYLDRHGMTAEEYVIPADPIEAAAQIAQDKWESSDTVVVAVNGNALSDDVQTVIEADDSVDTSPSVMRLSPDDPKFKDIGGNAAVPMFLGKSVGALHVVGEGNSFSGDTGILTPRYETTQEDWWPYPYDFNGPDYDTFFPVVLPGFWAPYVTGTGGLEQLLIEKYPGNRYTIPITDTRSSINVTITTDSPSSLMVYLVDPHGVLRRPNLPHWVGEPGPIHDWNGGHWQHDYDEYRDWIPEPTTQRSVEIHNPIEGKWTAIVVPHYSAAASGSINYHIKADVRAHNTGRCAAALSAANGAVLASLNHAPLLYVTADSVPAATSEAISALGASNIIFVNIDEISTADVGATTTYTTMQQVVDAIKSYDASDNYITITSLATGRGFFAPAAMMAAYHGSPVFDIGREAPIAYNDLDKARVTTYYMGDYYHGCLSTGHLHKMGHEFDFLETLKDLIVNQELPPLGFDQHKRWFGGAQNGIYGNITAKYGLDLEGKEAYLFVADRETDIRDPVTMVMSGNNSFAGHIPLKNPALDSALICRDILYPAIIYANPGRDICTSQLMNFADGRTWTTNDGTTTSVYTSRNFKRSFMSHGRSYEGHCLWENLLERYNEGALISYYSGHGTGGSGISAMYKNVAEQWPYAELRHEHLKDFEWWDAWRGYMYDDAQTKSPRWGGFTWYNAVEPNLYDIIHFKWVDQLFENLHSEIDVWMSCTTGSHMGPNIYLEHGAALWYGNGGTGLCPQEELLDAAMLHDMMIHGESIGEAFADYAWLHQRDFTTDDPTAMYGSSSLTVTNIQMIFGDPALIVYSPEWTEPTPIAP